MDILSISRKDLLILFKDRSTILQVFLLPLVFIVLFVGIGSTVEDNNACEGQSQADTSRSRAALRGRLCADDPTRYKQSGHSRGPHILVWRRV